MLVAGLAFAIPTFGSVSSDSGFEAADANLVAGSLTDWNSFAPVTWNGTAPTRTAVKNNGWSFKGFEDASVSATDTAFAGGVKQDDDCGNRKPSKSPNKDDLKRIYVATRNVGGDVFLVLGWVRIPQNSVTASAHIGYEFNQGTVACGGSPNLVKRVGGDMLIVYDFEGGSDVPAIKLSRWLTPGFNPLGASCEVNSSSILTGCWGDTKELTSLNFAEGLVNTNSGVVDDIKPPNGGNPGIVEFGEAGINLSDAGVFGATTCNAFGSVYAVSRSSGSSSQAAMMDIVGPGAFQVSNCGTVNVTKTADDDASQAGAVFTLYQGANTSGTVVGTCTVQANGSCTPSFTNLVPGQYTIDETTVPSGYTKDPDLPYTFTVGSAEVVSLEFENQAEPGEVAITKVDDAGNAVEGATFTIYSPQGISNNAPTGSAVASCTTAANGTCTITDVDPGNYTIDESVVPTGYAKASGFPQNISVANNQTVQINATNPRKFKMIVLVCREKDNTLYSSSVTINGDTRPSSLTPAAAANAGLSQSTLCGLSAGAKGGLLRSNNPQTASVTIPASPNP